MKIKHLQSYYSVWIYDNWLKIFKNSIIEILSLTQSYKNQLKIWVFH